MASQWFKRSLELLAGNVLNYRRATRLNQSRYAGVVFLNDAFFEPFLRIFVLDACYTQCESLPSNSVALCLPSNCLESLRAFSACIARSQRAQ